MYVLCSRLSLISSLRYLYPGRYRHRKHSWGVWRQWLYWQVFRLSSAAMVCRLLTHKAVYIVGRIILGFGLAAYLITSQVMIQEVAHPRSRARAAQAWVSLASSLSM